jgi:Xaa-Pro aminopeptidase
MDLPPEQWLERNAKPGWKIGYDPHLLTIASRSRFARKAEKAGAELIASASLVDAVWNDRPAPPSGKVSIQKMKHAGERALDKLARLAETLREHEAGYCLLTDPVSIAWAFNIRGDDIAHIPVTLARAILSKEGRPLLFIDSAKLNREAEAYLTQLAEVHPPQELEQQLRQLAGGAKVLCDPERVSAAFADIVKAAGGEIIKARDPVVLPRAIKNETEIAASRAAHLRDGVAVTRFLAWLDRQPAGSLDEITAARKLEEVRAQTAEALGSKLLEISFDTISGSAANGAIVHYRVNEASNARIVPDSLYLVDSGAQYRDGTTDITRTVAIGTPPVAACEDFTLVLKGHIAIATARFPKGTRGVDIDVLARIALWRHGRDYAHGTGHGIGAYLSVHEGPQSISRRGMEPLVAGMIISNEPGFYREGQWGIRIENLVLVEPLTTLPGGNVGTHAFETLTLAPIDQRLIDTALMTREELVWLDAYHARVYAELSPHLDAQDRNWLESACRPLRG